MCCKILGLSDVLGVQDGLKASLHSNVTVPTVGGTLSRGVSLNSNGGNTKRRSDWETLDMVNGGAAAMAADIFRSDSEILISSSFSAVLPLHQRVPSDLSESNAFGDVKI